MRYYSEENSIQEEYSRFVENILNDNFQQTFEGCYDKEIVNPIKWCKDYTGKFNELLCEKFGQTYSPYSGTQKIAIAHEMHPDGKTQAMIDFIRIYK